MKRDKLLTWVLCVVLLAPNTRASWKDPDAPADTWDTFSPGAVVAGSLSRLTFGVHDQNHADGLLRLGLNIGGAAQIVAAGIWEGLTTLGRTHAEGRIAEAGGYAVTIGFTRTDDQVFNTQGAIQTWVEEVACHMYTKGIFAASAIINVAGSRIATLTVGSTAKGGPINSRKLERRGLNRFRVSKNVTMVSEVSKDLSMARTEGRPPQVYYVIESPEGNATFLTRGIFATNFTSTPRLNRRNLYHWFDHTGTIDYYTDFAYGNTASWSGIPLSMASSLSDQIYDDLTSTVNVGGGMYPWPLIGGCGRFCVSVERWKHPLFYTKSDLTEAIVGLTQATVALKAWNVVVRVFWQGEEWGVMIGQSCQYC